MTRQQQRSIIDQESVETHQTEEMHAITYALRLLGFTVGACLDVFLIVVVVRGKDIGRVNKLVTATLAAIALWHAANAIALFQWANVGVANVPLLAEVSLAGLALAPAFLLHLGLAWGKLRNWYAAPTYLTMPLAWWALKGGHWRIYSSWVTLTLMAAAALCLYTAKHRAKQQERRFFLVCAGALVAIPVAGALFGPNSAAIVFASIAPPAVLGWFIYRYNFLNLLIGRRVVFALTLGVVFAFYLFLIRRIAGFVEEAYGALGPLTEVALIFAAALVWLPLYGWMTRFLSKRTHLYADFSKRLIEEAARILDLGQKLQFLAEELGRTFALRRVLLLAAGRPSRRGEFGERGRCDQAEPFDQIEKLVQQKRFDVVNAARSSDPRMARFLADLGFNYLLPLWYENRLSGLLFLDTSPRMFLDESEDILLGLSRQISHSLETCRVVEEKISLEKALVRQEHLASLGKIAATIAHEIKNPLSSVKTLARLMQEDPDVREKYDRDLAYMIGEMDRLNLSVQQLLSFSRPVPEQRQEVDLSELLEEMGQVLARQYAGERIRIEYRIEPQLKLKRGNPEVVRQILLNLVINAVQASGPDGNICLVAGARPPGNISISVSDGGPGIPAQISDKVFEPFFTTKQRGTGLGLAIVRKNVLHLGGDVQVESPILDGRGTRFEVTLPME